MSNATKFTDRGELVITLSTEDAVTDARTSDSCILRCKIKDTGTVIATMQLDSLFSAFSQEDASVTRLYGGTGLGLTISKKLCELMKGAIRVQSKKGQGSTFEFELTTKVSQRTAKKLFVSDLLALSILIIDDNLTALGTTKSQLQTWGALCFTANIIDEALQIISNQSADSFDRVMIDSSLFATGDRLRVPENNLFAAGSNLYLEENKAFSAHNAIDDSRALSTSPNAKRGLEPFAGTAILVVDDNEINREIAQDIINDLGFVCGTAENGSDALSELENHAKRKNYNHVGVVLVDCQVPVMDGYTATEHIRDFRAGALNARVPVIAMTANAMSEAKDLCFKAGMNDYLSKPIDEAALIDKLVRWLTFCVEEKLIELDQRTADSHAPQPTHPAQLPVWDEAGALRRMRNKPERLLVMANLFLTTLPERLVALKAAIEEQEPQTIFLIGHEIRGIAANLEGLALTRLSATMETMGKAQTNIDDILPPSISQPTKLCMAHSRNSKNGIPLWMRPRPHNALILLLHDISQYSKLC